MCHISSENLTANILRKRRNTQTYDSSQAYIAPAISCMYYTDTHTHIYEYMLQRIRCDNVNKERIYLYMYVQIYGRILQIVCARTFQHVFPVVIHRNTHIECNNNNNNDDDVCHNTISTAIGDVLWLEPNRNTISTTPCYQRMKVVSNICIIHLSIIIIL